MIDSVVVFAGLLIVRLIFAGISLAGGGAITGNGYPVSLFVERYHTVCSESVIFYCIYLSDRNDTWKESDESPGSFKKSGREADTVQCGVPRDGWKILM